MRVEVFVVTVLSQRAGGVPWTSGEDVKAGPGSPVTAASPSLWETHLRALWAAGRPGMVQRRERPSRVGACGHVWHQHFGSSTASSRRG